MPEQEVAQSLLPLPVLIELLKLAKSTPPGDFAELGVYRGGAAQYLSKVARSRILPWEKESEPAERLGLIYLFDTFTGIPFKGPLDTHEVGDFSDTSYEAVRALIPDAVIVQGIFPQSIIDQKISPGPFAFVHVDADQYESTVAATQYFPPLMVSGGLIIFDDYGYLPGVTRALHDWGEPFERTAFGRALWRKP
jgi:O-methyltransferase